MGKRYKNIVFCSLFCLCLVLIGGCDDGSGSELGLYAYSYMNPSGDILAILVGIKSDEQGRPAVSELKPVLLHLDEHSSLERYQQLDDFLYRGDLDWRPSYGNQLYYATYEIVYDDEGSFMGFGGGKRFSFGEGMLVMFDADSENYLKTIISSNKYPANLQFFRWSPNGQMLAGRVYPTGRLDRGELAISQDGGETHELTGIEYSGFPIWINDDELYLNSASDKNTILMVSQVGQNFTIKRNLSKDFSIFLRGVFHEKPVYTATSFSDDPTEMQGKLYKVFVGDELIHETVERLLYRDVIVCSDRIAVGTDRRVLIFDENLTVCHERLLPEKTRLLDFQSSTNTIFLVMDWKSILVYDYTKKEQPRVLFSVDMLNVRSK